MNSLVLLLLVFSSVSADDFTVECSNELVEVVEGEDIEFDCFVTKTYSSCGLVRLLDGGGGGQEGGCIFLWKSPLRKSLFFFKKKRFLFAHFRVLDQKSRAARAPLPSWRIGLGSWASPCTRSARWAGRAWVGTYAESVWGGRRRRRTLESGRWRRRTTASGRRT